MDTIDRHIRQGNRRNGGGGSGGGSAALETLAQESFDILELLPTYIEGIKTSVNGLSQETKVHFHQNEWSRREAPRIIIWFNWSFLKRTLSWAHGRTLFWSHAFLSASFIERTLYWAHALLSARFIERTLKKRSEIPVGGIIHGLLDWFYFLLVCKVSSEFYWKIKVCLTNQSVNNSSVNIPTNHRRRKEITFGHFFCHNHLGCHKTIKTRPDAPCLYPIKASQRKLQMSYCVYSSRGF